ncbi:hypothetical protein BJF78_32720 [Pseudonocardia sp. CNS-139]|nr:hypothetical protein BJF78_32720 [Pseudonocardia sp. CNS-139]
MSTTTLVGTPDPDDQHHQHDQPRDGEHGRVIDFPAPPGGPAREPLPTVVDGEVIVEVVDGDGARVPVDQYSRPADRSGRLARPDWLGPATQPGGEPGAGMGGELLPWQRREVVRRPVIAPWLTHAEDVRAASRWAAGWAWHVTGFHTVRSPLYVARLAVHAPRGLWVAGRGVVRWAGDAESLPLRDAAIRAGDADRYVKLTETRADRVRARRRVVVLGLLVTAGAGTAFWVLAPVWLVWVLLVAGVLTLGAVGTPADRPVTGRAVVRTEVQRLTSEIVIRALASLGIAEINKAMGKGGRGITFPARSPAMARAGAPTSTCRSG